MRAGGRTRRLPLRILRHVIIKKTPEELDKMAAAGLFEDAKRGVRRVVDPDLRLVERVVVAHLPLGDVPGREEVLVQHRGVDVVAALGREHRPGPPDAQVGLLLQAPEGPALADLVAERHRDRHLLLVRRDVENLLAVAPPAQLRS